MVLNYPIYFRFLSNIILINLFKDIFGIDYDPNEFGEEEFDDDDDDELDYDEERPKKRGQGGPKKTIYDAFEPDELIEKYYTDFDKWIRKEDEPERFLTRPLPVQSVSIFRENLLNNILI